MPKISVICPIYNRPARIEPVIRLLQQQTFSDWELILVDDHSAEDLVPAIEAAAGGDPRIRGIRRPANGGPSGARNTGLDAMTGDYAAFLDSDDAWEPAKLERQLAAATSCPHPELAFCVTRTQVIYGDGRDPAILPAQGVAPGQRFADYLYVRNGFAQCSSFFVGPEIARKLRFDERLRQYEDHLYFIAAGAMGAEYILIEDALVTWLNDARIDRMGRVDDDSRAEAFLSIARTDGVMSPAEELAFRIRLLGPGLAGRSRLRAAGLALRGLRESALPREAGAKLLLCAVLGPEGYARLRARNR